MTSAGRDPTDPPRSPWDVPPSPPSPPGGSSPAASGPEPDRAWADGGGPYDGAGGGPYDGAGGGPYDGAGGGPYDGAGGGPYDGAGGGPVNGMPGPYATPAPPREKARPGRAALVALAAVAVLTALGAPLGLLWANLAPGVPIIKTDQGAVFAEPSPEEFIAADGWFTLLGLGFGILAALAVWYLLRRHRGPLGMVTVALGAVGAGWLAWQVGRQIGREAFRRAVETAAVGDLIVRPPDLRAGGFEWLWGVVPMVRGDILMPAFGAVVTYTLLAGWSRYTTLRRETEPSWDSPELPAPAAAPAPPGPDATAPPRG